MKNTACNLSLALVVTRILLQMNSYVFFITIYRNYRRKSINVDFIAKIMARRQREPRSNGEPSSRRRRVEETLIDVLGGSPESSEICFYCFCSPCVANLSTLPGFVRGSAAADASNVARRFRLYKKMWSYLRKVGLWDFAPYKARKERMGHGRSPRDIIPWCIKQVFDEIIK